MPLSTEDLFGESGLSLEDVQKERKEYVKNIGIEYRYGCYEEKRGDSCHLLADYREAIELNFKSAFRLYKENCEERKYAKSCFKFAKYLMGGRECEANMTGAIEPLEIACRSRIPEACKLLSLVLWNGDASRPADSENAVKYQKMACDMDNGEACWMLSTWYMGPDTKFKRVGAPTERDKYKGKVERDMKKAIQYGSLACDRNIFQSCVNLSRIFKIGDGVPKDPDKAKEFYQKANEIVEYLQDRGSPGFTA